MTIIFPIISTLVLISISLYLFDNYKIYDHQRRNLSTLYWAMGFLVGALGQGLSAIISARLISQVFVVESISVVRFIMASLALLLIYSGVVQLITQNRLWRFYLPIALLILSSIWAIYTNLWLDNSFLATLGFAVFFAAPLNLFLGFLFLILFSTQLVQRQEIKTNLGPLILAIAFAINSLVVGTLPWVLDTPAHNLWLVFQIFVFLLIIWGLIRLERDAQRALDHKLKIHSLKITK